MNKISLNILIKIVSLVISISSIIPCQIPNAGFEKWSNGNPDGWIVDNDLTGGFVPVTPTSDSHSGNIALKGAVTLFQGIPLNPITGTVFPYSERPTNFTGYYKFTSLDSDSLVILVSLGSVQDNGGAGEGGSIVIKNNVTNYTKFNIPIHWVSQNPPDSCVITFTVYPKSPEAHAGTEYYIDDLSFTNSTTDVKNNYTKIPKIFNLNQNYPNPFNPTTTINYSIAPVEDLNFASSTNVQLKIFDILGNEITTLVNEEKTAGNYSIRWNAENLPSGVYFYRLQAGSYTAMKKMTLLK
jgi:Secretion system C-terminal sorting domain